MILPMVIGVITQDLFFLNLLFYLKNLQKNGKV